MPSLSEILLSPENKLVTSKLRNYSIAMAVIPIAVFYFFYKVVFGGDKSKLEMSGLAAVFAVNIVIFAYVRMAWNEDDKEDGIVAKPNAEKTD